jgi:hypothetical protein
MDIANANVEPYRKQHDFHEQINESLKMLTASVCHTIASLKAPNATHTLGDLIKAADPSWRFPPVWEPADDLLHSMLGFVGRLGIISVWSALDDFRVGIEAEVARWESFAKVELTQHEVDEREESYLLLHVLLTRFGWRRPQQENILTVLQVLVHPEASGKMPGPWRSAERRSRSPVARSTVGGHSTPTSSSCACAGISPIGCRIGIYWR